MKKTLPLFSANLLYALTMLLVIALGSTVQSVNLSWGLVVTELLLIGLPTLLFLRHSGVAFRSGLRLGRLDPLTGVLCVTLGIAMYLFGLLIEGIMAQLTGLKSVPIDNSMLPKTGWEMGAYFLGVAILAPVCEEILFRGAIQTAYESKRSVRFAITITALMFAFYHFRLSGLPALLPIAFVLGYVAWRTGSIFAAMLVHFGNNGTSAVQNITYFTTGKGLTFISLWSALAGLVVAIVVLLLIKRRHPAPTRESEVPTTEPARREGGKRWLATYWPLMIAGALYVAVGGISLAAALAPKALPADQATYGIPSLGLPVESRYEITNQGGQPVGEMNCTLSGQISTVRLDCMRTIHAYEYRAGQSYYKDVNHEDVISADWDAKTMALQSFSLQRSGEDGSVTTSTVDGGSLVSTAESGPEAISLDKNGLVEFEWAWHAALLKANSGESFSIPYAALMTWDESSQKSRPVVAPRLLRVYDDETLALPRGNITVRKVTLGDLAAWYAKDDSTKGLPRPVKLDEGVLVYTVVEG